MDEENIIYKIEILQLIERFYKVEINDEDVERIVTFNDLISLLKEKISPIRT